MTGTLTQLHARPEAEPVSEAVERLREEASPKAVVAHIKGMDPQVLRCRRLRQHKWEPTDAQKIRGGFLELLACERCGAEKERKYNSRGHIVEYGPVKYPEGYLLVGLGRIGEKGRDIINLASLNADLLHVGKRPK